MDLFPGENRRPAIRCSGTIKQAMVAIFNRRVIDFLLRGVGVATCPEDLERINGVQVRYLF